MTKNNLIDCFYTNLIPPRQVLRQSSEDHRHPGDLSTVKTVIVMYKSELQFSPTGYKIGLLTQSDTYGVKQYIPISKISSPFTPSTTFFFFSFQTHILLVTVFSLFRKGITHNTIVSFKSGNHLSDIYEGTVGKPSVMMTGEHFCRDGNLDLL